MWKKLFWDNESTRVVNPFFYFLFPADSKWEELHPGGERPPALQEHSAVAYKDCLYIFGGELGFSAGTETPLWVYNVKVTYHLRPNLSLSPSRERACMRTSTERKGKSSSRLLDVSLEIVWLSHPPRLNFVGRNFVPSEFKRFDLGKCGKARGYLASSCPRGSTPLWSGKSNETPCWPWLTISCFDAFRYRGLRLRTLLFLLAWNWLFQSSSSSHRELRFFIISLSFSDRIWRFFVTNRCQHLSLPSKLNARPPKGFSPPSTCMCCRSLKIDEFRLRTKVPQFLLNSLYISSFQRGGAKK